MPSDTLGRLDVRPWWGRHPGETACPRLPLDRATYQVERTPAILSINHQEPDRVPVCLGGSAATGINYIAYARLKGLLGLRTDNVQVYDVFGMMARMGRDVIDHLGIDTMAVPALCPRFGIAIKEWKPWRFFDGLPVEVPIGFQAVMEADGSLLLMVDGQAVGRMPKNGSHFSELANATMGGLDSLVDPPDPDSVAFPLFTEEDLRFREETARNLHETTDKALSVEIDDNLRWDTSLPNWLFAMAADPDRTFELHEKKSLNLIERSKQLAQAVGPYVHICVFYLDVGTQKAEMISPETFRQLIMPHYQRVFGWIHKNTNWKVFFHSCGSIYRLIPHMIDMGVDILNPVQCTAANMEPRRLKTDFGGQVVFWGGGVDTQTVLPFGTPDEVRQQVLGRVSILGSGGGYVFAPTQEIQADVPPENVLAMYDAAREYGRYPLETAYPPLDS